jgi:hypothetical protein
MVYVDADFQRNIACGRGDRHNARMTSDDADDEVRNPTYMFKPSLLGAPCRFTLEPEALHWDIGRYSGRIRYERVTAIRLSYRPVTMQSHRFIAEVRSSDNPTVRISSVSWRSMMQQERFDGPYAAFIVELHRRLAAAGSRARFLAGMPLLTYWIGVAVFGTVMVATGILVVRSMASGQWGASAIIAGFFAVFGYQLGNYFYRNWPARYAPDAIPPAVLPKS